MCFTNVRLSFLKKSELTELNLKNFLQGDDSMKKTIIGVLTALLLIGGLLVWQGENLIYLIFYDKNATMDLPENLYDDDSLIKSE